MKSYIRHVFNQNSNKLHHVNMVNSSDGSNFVDKFLDISSGLTQHLDGYKMTATEFCLVYSAIASFKPEAIFLMS